MTRVEPILDPGAIETASFAIIDREVGPHGFDARQWPVVRRIIHTTADFEFAAATCFAPGVIAAAVAALRRGASILCDTNMVLAGVNKTRLARFGCPIACHVADPEVAAAARSEGITRSIVATRKGVAEGCEIFLVGNAPTALFELLRLVEAGAARPALVVGVPVGFRRRRRVEGGAVRFEPPVHRLPRAQGGLGDRRRDPQRPAAARRRGDVVCSVCR